MILVTGGTGLVGAHLLLHLTEFEEKVSAIYRNASKIELTKKLFSEANKSSFFDKIVWIEADILDIPSLEKAFVGVDFVYHCAALITFDPNDEDKLRKTNIEGTANIVNLCVDFKVKKLCHVSSIAALGTPKDYENSITEETEWNPEDLHSDYAITKYGAEMEVWRGHQEGLEVVIVNPGVIFGYGFPKKGSDQIIQSVKKGMTFYTKGNIGIVCVEDVVKCMAQLMKSNINGERFTIVGENISTKELLDYIAIELQVKKPNREATKWITAVAWRMDWLISKLTNRKRRFSRNLAHSAHTTTPLEATKIENTLGLVFQKKEDYLKTILKLQ